MVAAVLAAAGEARADEAEGRRHWKAGQDLYQQKRFIEAAREFEAGYAVAPRPLFLLNIGHAYRRANELVKAKNAYEALLKLQPDLPQRNEVEGYIKSINDALQADSPSSDPITRPLAPPTSPLPRPVEIIPAPPAPLTNEGCRRASLASERLVGIRVQARRTFASQLAAPSTRAGLRRQACRRRKHQHSGAVAVGGCRERHERMGEQIGR